MAAGPLRSLAKRALGRVPIDYRHASDPDPGPEPLMGPVDVVVPVYGAAAEVERCAESLRLPTGVGVCLYVKRRVLDELGSFDENAFGLGYGEENDLCMRATKAGYVHVLDDATFIYHEGQRSVGSTREQRLVAGDRALKRRHPEYIPTIAAFIREDLLRPLRERVMAGLLARPGDDRR